MKLNIQKTVYPKERVNINEWYLHIHKEVTKTIINPNLKHKTK